MGGMMKLIDAPAGLLKYDSTIFLKTEYWTKNSTGIIPDCYLIDSGERFWGGVTTAGELCALEVEVVEIAEVAHGHWVLREYERESEHPYLDNYYCASSNCSKCGYTVDKTLFRGRSEYLKTTRFCPNCGAKMYIDDDSE